jgi:alpha-tubulin suppressor-like RCC1 family protein
LVILNHRIIHPKDLTPYSVVHSPITVNKKEPKNSEVKHFKLKTMKKHIFFISIIIFLQTATFIMPANSYAQKIACGFYHSLSICVDNTAMSWGNDLYGQLGNGISGSHSTVPVQVTGLTGVTAVAGGVQHSVALKDDGTVWTWGINTEGELGNGSTADFSTIPVQVTINSVTSIASGMEHAIALRNDGTVWDWGVNGFGQLGNGTITAFSNIPVQVTGLTGIIAIAGGAYHSLALKSNGEVWAWGYNGSGELGNGNNTNSNVPVKVIGLTGVIAVSCGNSFSIALKNDNTVWTWGGNNEGELGNGTNTGSYVPVQVTGLTTVKKIAGGTYHTLALKNDGTVWTWGFNLYGQLGNGTNTDSNIPVMVTGLTGVTAIAGGYAHSLALLNDGVVWSWGYNNNGQLGNETLTDSNIPVQVTGLCQVPTPVNEIAGQTNLSISPNPFENELIINGTIENGVVAIFDLTGKEIMRQKTCNNETLIKTAFLPKGYYLLNYKVDNKTTNIKLLKF